jgi:transcriptional regulator with XRE-family HTH domain
MRKLQLDGKRIKQLRENRERGSTQKEFAHEIRISERKLRSIENINGEAAADVAERISRAVGVPVPALIKIDDTGVEFPPPIPVDDRALSKVVPPSSRIVPRFDTCYAWVIRDEAKLFEIAAGNRVIVSHILTNLTAETSAYAEELLSVLQSLTWESRASTESIDSLEELALRRRLRELLVLLKGNDVWVYGDVNIKTLPESYEVQPKSSPCQYEMQGIIALGPPGEYGEESIKIPIDRGQPYISEYPF